MLNALSKKVPLISALFVSSRKRLGKIKESFEPFAIYYRVYGGVTELIFSPYIWIAVALTYVCHPFWLAIDEENSLRPAIDLAITFVPRLMAFTLGGMAIVLALSGRRFTEAIREEGKPESLFMQVVVLFFHFLLVQSIALVLALISRTYIANDWLAGAAFFFALYGVSSAVAIAAMLLNVSRIYNLTGGGDDNA